MISVVVPSFNEEERIEACLTSLVNQTLPRNRYEIIVVDGGSQDRTREIAEKYGDLVFIQTSPKVGGARNDGALRAKGEILVTTDADTYLPPDWLERIERDFDDPEVVMVYGPVRPIERTIKNQFYLFLANTMAWFGAVSRTIYFTLGCNSAFRHKEFMDAGMYRVSDAGDDLEIAHRMRALGTIKFDRNLWVGFSMRRYNQFGALKSVYEWFYIVFNGGDSDKYAYTRREYK
ncbi:MAG TPA: glycosyltransferase [Methanospirillum sp.]|nr:glycosyltransferase [Methanospirillum sp.]